MCLRRRVSWGTLDSGRGLCKWRMDVLGSTVLGSLLSALLCSLNAEGFMARVAVYTQMVANAE